MPDELKLPNEPRTIPLLYDLIDEEYKWRIVELSNYRSSLDSEKNPKAKIGKIRAGVALLYAHWEGFIKRTTDYYYSFVSFQNNNLEDLNDAFASIFLKQKLNSLENDKKLKNYHSAVKSILEDRGKVPNFSSSSPIRTSNLKFSLFEDICLLIGVDPLEFERRYKRDFDRSMQLTIDDDLVGRRNKIAHGEYLPIKYDDFIKLYDIIVKGFLYNFKEIIMDAAQNKHYLRVK